ncbi:TIGR04282 family arsenosugar biosynthesis glycosyltransferase [Desulfobacterota bacterium AH_259_B03_O07]|nr:TIGR04282 family arsenosugar biosynthesis glycosyltransferase [Desulfobacterota bacterium AH_259_B03_O07]
MGNENAAEIYSFLAKSIIDKVIKSNSYNLTLFFDPPNKKRDIINWLNNKNYELIPQDGDSLGNRMANAFDTVFSQGYNKAIIIGTDCMEISIDLISRAFQSLSKTEVVLGPSEDGGYYLIGLNKTIHEIFYGIQWSTKHVLHQTLNKLTRRNHEYQLLETLRDIDTIRDIREEEILKRIKI